MAKRNMRVRKVSGFTPRKENPPRRKAALDEENIITNPRARRNAVKSIQKLGLRLSSLIDGHKNRIKTKGGVGRVRRSSMTSKYPRGNGRISMKGAQISARNRRER